MRVFRDVDMVESLGSGMKRIGNVYPLKDIFSFSTNFIKTSIQFHSQKVISSTTEEKQSDDINVLETELQNVPIKEHQLTDRQKEIIRQLRMTAKT